MDIIYLAWEIVAEVGEEDDGIALLMGCGIVPILRIVCQTGFIYKLWTVLCCRFSIVWKQIIIIIIVFISPFTIQFLPQHNLHFLCDCLCPQEAATFVLFCTAWLAEREQ